MASRHKPPSVWVGLRQHASWRRLALARAASWWWGRQRRRALRAARDARCKARFALLPRAMALSSRLDQVSPRCWLNTSPPRRRDAPHAHDAGAERARGVRVGLGTPYSAPSCLLPLGLFTRGQCSAASGRPAHYHASRQPAEPQPAEPQHAPYVRAEGARVDHTAPTLHPRTRGVHTERLCPHTSDPCIPARPLTA